MFCTYIYFIIRYAIRSCERRSFLLCLYMSNKNFPKKNRGVSHKFGHPVKIRTFTYQVKILFFAQEMFFANIVNRLLAFKHFE